MKYLLLPLITLALASSAHAQAYEKLEPRYYHLSRPMATAFRNMADTLKGVVKIPQTDDVQVVGRVAPSWAVVKRAGFDYYMPAHYLVGFAADPARATAQLKASVPRTEEYCVLHTQGNAKGFAIQVDYGQQMRLGEKERDSGGNRLDFNSAVDALNFMNSNGWELVTVYSGTATTGLVSYPAMFYVMRRRIQS